MVPATPKGDPTHDDSNSTHSLFPRVKAVKTFAAYVVHRVSVVACQSVFDIGVKAMVTWIICAVAVAEVAVAVV